MVSSGANVIFEYHWWWLRVSPEPELWGCEKWNPAHVSPYSRGILLELAAIEHQQVNSGSMFNFLIFTPGEMIHFEEHIFQIGWNHHLHSLKLTQCLKIDRPKRKRSYSNHPFSGAICEFHGEYIPPQIFPSMSFCASFWEPWLLYTDFPCPEFGPSTPPGWCKKMVNSQKIRYQKLEASCTL